MTQQQETTLTTMTNIPARQERQGIGPTTTCNSELKTRPKVDLRFPVSFLLTGDVVSIAALNIEHETVILDRDDYEVLVPCLAYAHLRITVAGVPQIKLLAWRRWRDLDFALTGTNCARRNGDMFDLRRDNLIPARKANLYRFGS